MPNKLVDIYRSNNPGTLLTDDQITMRYAEGNAADLAEIFRKDPSFETDYRRITQSRTNESTANNLDVSLWNSPPSSEAPVKEYTGGFAPAWSGDVSSWDRAKSAWTKFTKGFMEQNVATTLPESIGLGTAALNWSTGLPDTSRRPGETDEDYEARYEETASMWGPTPHDPKQTTTGSIAEWMKEDVYEFLTPELEERVVRGTKDDFWFGSVAHGLGSGVGFIAGGGFIGKIIQKGIQKAAGETFEKVLKETTEAALKKGATQQAANLTAQKAAQEAAEAFAKKAMARSTLKTTASLGMMASGPQGYNDAIANGASEGEAFAAWLLNAGLGVSEVIPLNKMIGRLTGTGAATGLRQALVNAGREGMEEAMQEWLQGRGANAIAAWIVAYDPDRKLMAEWKDDAKVGGATGVILSLLSSIVGVRVHRKRQEESGIDPEAIKDIEANIVAGKPLNDSEKVRATQAGYYIDEGGIARIPETPAETARLAYTGGKSAEIVALAQREATEGFSREIEEEYNKLIGVGNDADKYAKQLYDQTKRQAQSVAEAEKSAAEAEALIDEIMLKVEAGEDLSDEESALLQAAAAKKGGPLSPKEKLDALREAAHGGYMGENAQREEEVRREEADFEEKQKAGIAFGKHMGTIKTPEQREADRLKKKEEDDEARLRATEAIIAKRKAETAANNEARELKRQKAALAATVLGGIKPEAAVEEAAEEEAPKTSIFQRIKDRKAARQREKEIENEIEKQLEGATENGKEIARIAVDGVDNEKTGIAHSNNIKTVKSRIRKLKERLKGKTLNGKEIGENEIEQLVPGLDQLEGEIEDYEGSLKLGLSKEDAKERRDEIREMWQSLYGTEHSLETIASLGEVGLAPETEEDFRTARREMTDDERARLQKEKDKPLTPEQEARRAELFPEEAYDVGGGETTPAGYPSAEAFESDVQRWEYWATKAEEKFGTRYSQEAAAFIAEQMEAPDPLMDAPDLKAGPGVVYEETTTKPETPKPKGKTIDPAKVVIGESNATDAFNAGQERNVKAAERKAKKQGEVPGGQVIRDSKITRTDGPLQHTDVAVDPNAKAGTETGGPGYVEPGGNTNMGQELQNRIDAHTTLSQSESTDTAQLEADGIISMSEDAALTGVGWRTNEDGNVEIWADGVSKIGEGATVQEAIGEARSGAARRIGTTLLQGAASPVGGTSTRRIVALAAPDGKVVTLGVHGTQAGVATVPNITNTKAKSMPLSELIDKHGYKVVASVRTSADHVLFKETFESKEAFDTGISQKVKGLQAVQPATGIDEGAKPSDTPSNIDPETGQPKKRMAPRRHPRPSDAKVNVAFSNIADAARTAGVSIKIVQGEFADVEKKAAAYMTLEDGRVVATLAMESVNNPTNSNTLDLLHEINHVVFDQLDPETQAAIDNAIEKASDKALGTDHVSAFLFDSTLVDQVPSELRQEERIVEAVTNEMVEDGFDPENSKGLIKTLVRIWKNVSFAAKMAWQRMIHGADALSPTMAKDYFRLQAEAFLTGNTVPRFLTYLIQKPTLMEAVSRFGGDVASRVFMSSKGVMAIEPVDPDTVSGLRFNMRYAGIRRYSPTEGVDDRVNTQEAKRNAASNNAVLQALKNVFAAFTMSGANRNTEGGVLVDEEGFLRRIMGRRTKSTVGLKEIEATAGPEIAATTLSELDDVEDKPRAAMNADRMLSSIVNGLKDTYAKAMDKLNPNLKNSISNIRAKLYSDLEEMRKNYTNISFVINKLQEGLAESVKTFIDNPRERRSLYRTALVGIDESLVGKFKATDWQKQPTPIEMEAFHAMVLAGVDFSKSPADVMKQITELAPAQAPQDDRQKILLAKFMVMAQVNPVAVDMLLLRGEKPDYKNRFDRVIRIAFKGDRKAVERAFAKYKDEFPEVEGDKFKTGEFAKFNLKARRLLDKIAIHRERYRGLDNEINQARQDIAIYETTRATIAEQRAGIEALYDKEKQFNGVQWEPINEAEYMVPTSPDQDIADAEKSLNTLDLTKKLDAKVIFDHIERMTAWLKNQPENMRGEVWRTMLRQRDKLITLPADQMQRDVSSSWIMRLLGDYVSRLETIGNAKARKVITSFKAISRYMNTYGGERANKIGRDWAKDLDDVVRIFRRHGGTHNRDDVLKDEYTRAFHFFDENRDVLNENPGEKGERMLLNMFKAHWKVAEKDSPGFVDAVWPKFEKLILTTRKASRHVNEMRKEMGLSVKDEFGDYVFFRDTIGDSLTTTMRKPSSKATEVFDLLRDKGWEKIIPLHGSPWLREAYANRDVSPEFDNYVESLFTDSDNRIMDEFVGPLVNKTGVGFLTGRAENGFRRPIPQSILKEAYELNPDSFMGMLETLADKEGITGNLDRAAFIADSVSAFMGVYKTIRGTQERSTEIGTGSAMPPHIMMDARHTTNWPAEWVEYATFGQRNIYQYAKHLATEAAFGRDMAMLSSDLDIMEKELTTEKAKHEDIERELRKEGFSKLGRHFTGKFNKAYNAKAKAAGFNPKELKKASSKLKNLAGIKKNIELWLKAESSTPLEYMALNDFTRTLAGFTVQAYGTALIDTISIVEQPFRKMGLGRAAFGQVLRNVGNSLGIGTGSFFQLINKNIGFQADKMQLLQEFGLDDMTATLEGNFFSRIWDNWRALQADEFIGEWWEGWRPGSRIVEHAARAGRAILGTGGGKAEEGKGAYPAFRPLTPFTQLAKQSAMASTMSTWSQFTTLILKTTKLLNENPKYKDILMSEGVLFDDAVLKKHGLSLNKVIQELGYGRSFLVFNDTRAFLYMQDQLQKNGFSLERAAMDYIKRRAKDAKADPIGNKDLYRSLANLTLSEMMLETDLITRPVWMTSNPVGQFVVPLLGWSVSKSNDVRKEFTEPGGQTSLRGVRWAMSSHLAIMPIWAWYAFFRDEFDEEIVGKKSDVQRGQGMALLPGYPSFAQWEEDPVDSAQIVLERMDRVGAGGILGEAAVWFAGQHGAGVREFSVGSRVFALNSLGNLIGTLSKWGKQGGPFGGATTWQTIGRPLAQSLGGSGFLQTAQIANNLTGRMLGEPPAVDAADYWVNHRIGVVNYIRAAGRELNLDIRKRGSTPGSPSKMKAHVGQMVLAALAEDFSWFHQAKRDAEEAIREDGVTGPEIQKRLLESFQSHHPLRSPFKAFPTAKDYENMLEVIGESSGEDAREGVRRGIENFNKAITWLYGKPFEGKEDKATREPPRFRTRPRSMLPPRPRPGASAPPSDYRARAATMNP